MSLKIDPARVTAVYALGQWHYVAEGSFYLDAYELTGDYLEFEDYEPDVITLGDYYPDGMSYHAGACWEAQCGSQIAMPLLEIKAFKFDKTKK
jgi:hypothetical protein